MILILNYDPSKTSEPLFLQEGLFMIPQTFLNEQDAEDYLFSPQCIDLPFEACMLVPIESVPQQISVPHDTQLWLKSTLGREESFVPFELFESVPLLALSNDILKPEPTRLS
ncbi:hypothetical protein GOQ04_14960 [Emticicia sp. ODNR4P]|nr:hypothetical protein [Emticicia sp. ODNR4P]